MKEAFSFNPGDLNPPDSLDYLPSSPGTSRFRRVRTRDKVTLWRSNRILLKDTLCADCKHSDVTQVISPSRTLAMLQTGGDLSPCESHCSSQMLMSPPPTDATQTPNADNPRIRSSSFTTSDTVNPKLGPNSMFALAVHNRMRQDSGSEQHLPNPPGAHQMAVVPTPPMSINLQPGGINEEVSSAPSSARFMMSPTEYPGTPPCDSLVLSPLEDCPECTAATKWAENVVCPQYAPVRRKSLITTFFNNGECSQALVSPPCDYYNENGDGHEAFEHRMDNILKQSMMSIRQEAHYAFESELRSMRAEQGLLRSKLRISEARLDAALRILTRVAPEDVGLVMAAGNPAFCTARNDMQIHAPP